MWNLFLMLALLLPLTATAAKTPKAPKDWNACKEDKDCLKVEGVCGRAIAIRADQAKAFEEHRLQKKMEARCVEVTSFQEKQDAALTAYCKDEKNCELK